MKSTKVNARSARVLPPPAGFMSHSFNPASLALPRPWAKALVAVAGIIFMVGVLVPYTVNVDRYRVDLTTAIAKQTGRPVTLGRLRARVLPYFGLDIERFSMGNPAGFVRGEFLSAQHVRGRVAFWPLLLRQELRLASLELLQPKLVLLQDDRRQNNFTFPAPEVLQASPAPSSFWQVDRVLLDDAELVLGRIDAAGHTEPIIDALGFNVTLRQLVLRPLTVSAWLADATLKGARVTLANWNGPINFSQGKVTLRRGELESAFAADFGKNIRVQGTLAVADVENAMVRFDLKVADIDLKAMHAGTQNASPPRQATPAAIPRGGQPPVPVLAASTHLVAQGHVAAERIRWEPYVAGPATVDLRLYEDRMEIWPIVVRFESGSLQASARTDSRQEPKRFSVNLEARNLNLEHLLSATPGMRGKFAGTGELDLQVFGSLGASWQQSLTGKGQFAIRNGRISGFSLSNAAQSTGNGVPARGDTTFVAITGDIDVANQRVTSRNIHLESPRGTMDLMGSSGLDGSLDYDGRVIASSQSEPEAGKIANTLQATPVRGATQAAGGPSIPFTLRGTLLRTEFLPGRGTPKFSAPVTSRRTGDGSSFPNLFQK